MTRRSAIYFVCFLFIIDLFCQNTYSQSYGLGFYSHEKVADQRTSLELFPDKGYTASGNFDVSFQMSFLPEHQDYYGYIFRIVADGKTNFDLIYNKRDSRPDVAGEDNRHFKLIIDDHFTNIAFHVDQKELESRWTTFRLLFDIDKNRITLYVNGKSYSESNARLQNLNVFRFFWGINNFGNFKTSDCPPIKIRDIRLSANGHPQYYWPLNETTGSIAHEHNGHEDARIINPLWIRSLHYQWTPLLTSIVKGSASVAYSNKNSALYLVGEESLLKVSLSDLSTVTRYYHSGKLNLYPSNESVFDDETGILYNYYIDKLSKKITAYDFNTDRWERDLAIKVPGTDYWQTNNMVSSIDSSIYIIGGYGQLTYKNSVIRYHIPDGKWNTIQPRGDYFCPRYLSSVGHADGGRTLYLIGGYGSMKGEQMLNPKNLYDFFSFDVKSKTFRKLFEFKHDGEDFAFANNMYIDPVKRTYTALTFPNYRYNSHLRLITGNLDNPNYQFVGDSIPFLFHDTHAFASLYFSKQLQKLIAVTLLRDEKKNETAIKVFSLYYPPVNKEPAASISVKNGVSSWIKVAGGVALLIILGISGRLLYVTLRQPPYEPLQMPLEAITTTHKFAAKAGTVKVDESPERKVNAIYCFGDLEFFDSEGQNLIKKFSPLLKELFLVTLLHSFKNGRGVSPDKLLELLWLDKSEEDARNNRSTNVSKLKTLLSNAGNIELSKQTGNYKINFDPNVIYCDYYEYLKIMENGKDLSKEGLISLISIINRGSFLPSIEYQWLDTIKSDVSNGTTDFLIHSLSNLSIEGNAELIITVANCMFLFDTVNEEAMTAKCKALAYLGKHSLAKSTFEKFQKEYEHLYGENYRKKFNEILGGYHEKHMDTYLNTAND